jgi:hypothetical protein
MSSQPIPYLTPEEYLALERKNLLIQQQARITLAD